MEDERLAKIEQAKLDAINQSNNTYDQMHQDNQNLLNQQTNYAEQYEQTQNEALDKQLDFYKQNIEQQKKNAQQNYETESRKAENDYVAYNNPYGYQAEMMASKGQLQSGISQTSQLGSYNAYQNRLATANKTMQDAFTQYDLDMNEAIINNDVQKAQNALAKLEMILGFQQNFYDSKNQIAQSQLSNNQALDESYHGRYMDMINQINAEKELAEKIRQYEQNLAYQKERDKIADEQWQKEYNLAKKSASRSSGGNSPEVKGDDEIKDGGSTPEGLKSVMKNDGKPLTVQVNGGTQEVKQASDGKYYYWNTKNNTWTEIPGANVTVALAEAIRNSVNNMASKILGATSGGGRTGGGRKG
jgi:hypothetical protein